MLLRPHQEKAVQMLRQSLARGNKRPLLAAPCSFGKTITAAYILNETYKKGNRGLFIADRVKLIQQTVDSFTNHQMPIGVMQGSHEMNDPSKPIQIASVQTLARRKWWHLEPSVVIVDECHVHYDTVTKMMEMFSNVPFIGLSATPYSRGLGQYYDDLILPITPRGLLDKGYLCPIHYYGGKRPDLSGVRRRRIRTGGSDYDDDSLGEVYENDKALAGDIIYNWMQHGENSQTIAFSPSIKHSKFLVEKFNLAGIPAVHIDGYMDDEERQIIYEAHDRGEYKILSCSRLLNTGYDAPSVKCLIDCFPTASKIALCQRYGRVQRTYPGKDYAIILDHAGNCQRHGFVEDIVPESLDDGRHRFDERNQIKKEKKEPKVKECPQCTRQFIGIKCVCGYEIPWTQQIVTDDQILTKLNNNNYSQERKAEWLGELYLYAEKKGKTEGWANHKYKEKFKEWPNARPILAKAVSDEVSNWIKHQNIKYAKGKAKYDNRKYLAEVG